MIIYNKDIVITDDGTLTVFNKEYGEHYHSLVGAKKEATEKFILPSGISNHKSINLLDIGFGLGYNAFYSFFSCDCINIISLEKDISLLKDLETYHPDMIDQVMIPSLKKQHYYKVNHKSLTLVFNDARLSTYSLLKDGKKFTHIFLDAFSPRVNPELWTLEFFKNLYSLLENEGVFVTYSSSLAVMSALKKVGFIIYYTPNIGRKRGGILALKNNNNPFLDFNNLFTISKKDEYLLKYSVQSIPNRDKNSWNGSQIYNHRKKMQNLVIRLGFLQPHKRAIKNWEMTNER